MCCSEQGDIEKTSIGCNADDATGLTSTNPKMFSIEASAPQLIRVGGLHDVFRRHADSLHSAVCIFGVDNEVPCRCDTFLGTVECHVPSSSVSAHDSFVVKARIADFETPSLKLTYSVTSPADDHNVLLKPPTASADDASTDCSSSHVSSVHTRLLSKLSRETVRNPSPAYSLLHQCIAELLGTMFIVIFGVGSVCSAVLLKTNVDLWHIATVWGFGVALAILVSASISGGHLNPAVSLAFAMFRPKDFPANKLLPYWLAQYLGGMLGGAFNLMVFGPAFRYFESDKGITRGEYSGLATAKAFGEYFPAPGGYLPDSVISPAFAMLVEAWGTGILMFVILAVTDPRQKIIRNKEMIPFYIGFTVAILITLYAPLTQAGWNPARDFGPRIIAALAGWGRTAIPGPRNGFWVYIIGPKIGAPIGALLYDVLVKPGLTN